MPVHLLPAAEAGHPTRRRFLAGLTLGGASLVLGRPTFGAAEPPDGGWLALVSDPHIAADPATRRHDQAMAENLRAVVAGILAAGAPPAGVLIDGDLALKDGQEGDYRTLLELLDPLRRARLPVHLTLGNHDDRDHFRAVVRPDEARGAARVEKHVGDVAGPGVRLVLLDSLRKTDEVAGELGGPQLGWLTGALDAHPAEPTLVFVHHNISTGAATALADQEALMAALGPRRQVKAVIFGHTHAWDLKREDGIHLVNLPAVGYPFNEAQPLGWVALRPTAGGADLELHAVGGNRSRDGERVRLEWRAG